MGSNRRTGAGPARATMFAALLILCLSAMSLSMFSLELQTQVRAAITQSLETRSLSPVQDPVAATVAASQTRSEPQLNATSADDRALSACRAGRRGDTEAISSLIAMLSDDSKIQLIRCWDTGRWSPALQTFKQPSPGEQAALALASFGRPAFEPLSSQLDS